MEKLKVCVVSNDIDIKIKLKNLLNEGGFAAAGFLEYDNMTSLKLGAVNPDAVLLAYDRSQGGVFETAEQIYCGLAGAGVILLSQEIGLDLLDRAMRHGIKQVLPLETTAAELKDAIIKAHTFEKKRNADNAAVKSVRSKVISYFGGKGGTGKTTVAVNTAAQLAQNGKKTVIIDADLQFGDVTVMLDLDAKDTIYELSRERGEISVDVAKSMLALHKSGLEVLAAPKSPELAEYITDKMLELIINTVRPYYEYIIIDLPPGFNDTAIAAIENSDIVNLVTTVDITSLRNAKICADIIEALGQKEKLRLILNRMSNGIITKKDFESVLGLSPELCIPDDTKTALSCLNRGEPFVIAAPKCTAAKNIRAYAAKL